MNNGSPKEFIAALCATSAADGVMDTAQTRGYSEEELSAIERAASAPLPAYYKEFLRVLGKDGGGFNRGTNMFPKSAAEIANWVPWATRLMANSRADEPLPPNAFVFADHQGYQFWYFLLAPSDDDPRIYYFHEFWKGAKLVNSRFSDFLAGIVQADRMMKHWLEGRMRARDAARAAFEAGRNPSDDA